MPNQVCRCCAWTNIVPDQAGDAFVSCPECGQMLVAPAPWSSVDIPNCDTRPMISWQADVQDSFAPADTILVPWELTCQVGKVSQGTPRRLIPQGLFFIGLGIVFLATSHWAPPGDFLRWLGPLVGLLMLVSGVVALHCGMRKRRRRTQARVVRLAESLPAEAYHLGAPVALHQMRLFWRGAYVCLGSLLCIIAGVSGAMVLSGQVRDHRVVEIAFLGWPAGLYMVWQGMKLQAKRILVFADGLVTFDEGRAVVYRWDQIEEVWLTLKEKTGDMPQRFVLTLHRNDGEKVAFTSDTEYIENQLVARVQYEHCACQLPSMQARLDHGGTLDFGAIQVGRDGIHWDQDSFGWNEIRTAILDKANVRIMGDCRNCAFKVATVPNLAILLALIRQRSGLMAVDGPAAPTPPSSSRTS